MPIYIFLFLYILFLEESMRPQSNHPCKQPLTLLAFDRLAWVGRGSLEQTVKTGFRRLRFLV